MEVCVNVYGNVWDFCICYFTVILDIVLWVRRRTWVMAVLSLNLYARNTVFKG